MISIYQLKSRFQNLLRPAVKRCALAGITANAVTLTAMLISLGLGALLLAQGHNTALFLLLPVWMFLRMAFNAIDGMLAREFKQKSALGAYLNELSDVISDAALYLPFGAVSALGWGWIGLIIFLSTLSEMAGALGPMVGAERRYDGPMGKSDRAFVFGTLGLWLGLAADLPAWISYLMPIVAACIACNTVIRIRRGVQDSALKNAPTSP